MFRWSLSFLILLAFGLPVTEAQQRKKEGRFLRLRVNLGKVQPGNWQPKTPGGQTNPGGPGIPGGPGGGEPGFPNSPMGPGGPGTGMTPTEGKTLWVEARFWARDGRHYTNNPNSPYHQFYVIEHDFGTSLVPAEFVKPQLGKHPKQWFKAARAGLIQKRDNSTLIDYLTVTQEALQRGMPTQAKEIIELAKKERNFTSKEFSLYLKTLKAIGNPPKGIDPTAVNLVDRLEKEGYRSVTSSGGHFQIVTTLAADDREVTSRLDKLELLYTTFFGWFALHGKEIPQPNHRLICVLESRKGAFKKAHNAHFTIPLHANQFVLPRTNVAYLYTRPIAADYIQLKSLNEGHWESKGWSVKQVLNAHTQENARAQIDLATQALGIIQKAMEERAKVEATTYAGTQQLLAATGLLPQNVIAAQWVRTGMARFFGTSRDAFYHTSAVPNWREFIDFKDFQRKKKLPSEKNPAACGEMMFKVVTDNYFHAARATIQLRAQLKDPKEREKATETAKEQLGLGRATSWALTYYLMNNKLDTMLAYLEQLRQLPRDVDYDGPIMAKCFARAWGPNPFETAQDGMNPGKYNRPARDWVEAVSQARYRMFGLSAQLVREREQAEEEAKKEKEKKKKGPTGPGFPGPGSPGSGCGGDI